VGSRVPGGARRWLGQLARSGRPYGTTASSARLLLLAGGVGLLLLAGGAVALLPHQTGHGPRSVADDCGMVTCTATLPASVTGSSTLSASPSAQPWHTANTAAASAASTRAAVKQATSKPPAPPIPTRGPASSPSPSMAAPPAPVVSVTVSYSMGRWFQGIQGRFVIVNHGSTPVTGWNLAVTLPGDGNFRVWNAQDRVNGDTLIINAAPNAQTLGPGAIQQVTIFAEGGTSAPSSCTFDGAAVCQAQQGRGPGPGR
jgi:hypothetical protein